MDLPGVDASSSLEGLGAVELDNPNQDIDGDGILDTVTTTTPESMQIWSDYDNDGIADRVTVVEKDGDYAAWEFHRYPDGTSEWVRTDKGTIGE